MEDELNLQDEQSRAQERIIKLNSEKKAAEAATAEATAKVAEAEAKALAAEKERDFYASFTESAAKYPGAVEYKDKIKEKVLAGYSHDDAVVSVLNSEGKLMPQAKTVEIAPAAGGSAVNQLPDAGTKTLYEMTREEKRAALVEEEKKGNISLT